LKLKLLLDNKVFLLDHPDLEQTVWASKAYNSDGNGENLFLHCIKVEFETQNRPLMKKINQNFGCSIWHWQTIR